MSALPGGTGCRLYLLTPPAFDRTSFPDTLARALDAGDVAAVQLRLKDVDEKTLRETIATLAPIAQSRGVAFILNDDPRLAVETGCDGAHVGQTDTKARDARRILGRERTLGVTCHASRDLAMRAGEAGADYIAFGSFFVSSTKREASHADTEILRWSSEVLTLPTVAIGGITAANCAPLVRAGVNFLAVIAAVWSYPEGAAAGVRALEEAIARAEAEPEA